MSFVVASTIEVSRLRSACVRSFDRAPQSGLGRQTLLPGTWFLAWDDSRKRNDIGQI